jgi:hypothetical protein
VPSSRLFFFPHAAPSSSPSSSTPATSAHASTPFIPGSIPSGPATDNETVEHEATDFAEALEAIALAGATGEDSHTRDETTSEVGTIEETIENVVPEAAGEGGKPGKLSKEEKKAAKKAKKEAKEKKKEEILGKHGKTVMVLVGDLAEGWERWAK